MDKKNRVSFIGSGNVAWHLAPELDNHGYFVTEVYSRDSTNAQKLVNRLYNASLKTNLDFSNSDSIVFIIAVTDDSIIEIAREIALPDEAIWSILQEANLWMRWISQQPKTSAFFIHYRPLARIKKLILPIFPFVLRPEMTTRRTF